MPSLILYCFVFGLSISSLGAAFVPIPARCPTSQQKQSARRSCSLTPVTPAQRSPPPLLALHMFHGPEANDGRRQFAASVLASTCVLTGILTSSTAALAMTTNHNMPTCTPDAATTSTLTLSARSGGGTEGRSASSSRPAFRLPSRLPGSATSRQYGQAVIVRPSPVLSSGFGLVDLSPFGYDLSSYGASGAASVINENIRDARQESKLRDERIELATVRQREAKLGQRMKLLGQQQQRK